MSLPLLDFRAEYDPKDDLLDEEFMLKGKWYQRKDLELKNIRGDALKCSHYMPIISPEGKPLPCVIYCHGNSGSRADASEAAIILLPSNITVFALDFSGSGLSGGEHVTLGWNEKDDLKSVVEYLRRDGNISSIGLWGRSMGAVTSLLYGAQDPSIAGIVLDSPFSNLVDLMMEVAGTNAIRLPKFTLKFAIQFMRRSVLKKAKFDITELDTIKVARRCFVPLLLGHAVDDDFIQPHHSDRIFDAYMGEKNIIKFDGDHNSQRPQFYFDSVSIFFNNVLQPPDDDTFFDIPPDYFGKQGVVAYPAPSSSNLISFELSNGDPCGPGVLASIDDDEYVEYSLDNLADFSESMEDENKMIMEAVKESLKDLETRPSRAEELSSSTKQPESLSDHDSQGSAMEQPVPSNESPMTPIVTNGHGSAPELQVADTNKTSAGPPNLIPSANKSENSGASVDIPSSASIDLVDHTKVTVTVIKNPTSNIMNGLLRRWDLNFFRNR
nr:Alpha/beta hydrolase fold [Ipomoea batatas]